MVLYIGWCGRLADRPAQKWCDPVESVAGWLRCLHQTWRVAPFLLVSWSLCLAGSTCSHLLLEHLYRSFVSAGRDFCSPINKRIQIPDRSWFEAVHPLTPSGSIVSIDRLRTIISADDSLPSFDSGTIAI